MVFAATPQRHRQAGNLEVPPATSFSGQSYLQAAEKLLETTLHKKMAASGMEYALRTFYVHAAAPANSGDGRAARCKPPVLCLHIAVPLHMPGGKRLRTGGNRQANSSLLNERGQNRSLGGSLGFAAQPWVTFWV